MPTHKSKCVALCYIKDHTHWHSAICESLNDNYKYAYRYSGSFDYARALCQLIEKAYENDIYQYVRINK